MKSTNLNHETAKDPEARLSRLMQRLWNIPDGGFQKGKFDITMPQLRLIVFISRNSGCHLQDIAEGLDLTPPTVSVGIRKLEEGGWLERRSDPEDGRATCVFLTKESERIVQEALAHQKQVANLFFSGLSGSEQEQLLELLEKGIHSVESHLLKD